MLGPANAVWDQLLADLSQEFDVKSHEWKCYSPNTGWALRVKRKERTIVWLAPHPGSFGVLFILGEKAMRAARQSKLPQGVLKALDEAPKYPGGTGLRLDVKSPRDVRAPKQLAAH